MIVADLHVHLYPDYDPERFWSAAFANLDRLHASPSQRVLFLTERHDCHAFRGLADGSVTAPGLEVEATEHSAVLRIRKEGAELYLVAGRQIATQERLEILAMGCDGDFKDGKPVDESLADAKAAGAVAVLGWSPGKWLGRRSKIVRRLIEAKAVDAVGDTALRPIGYATPMLMRRARALGLPILPGTDPLPLPDEEPWVALYAGVHEGDAVEAKAVLDLLRSPNWKPTGRRLGPFGVFGRIRRL